MTKFIYAVILVLTLSACADYKGPQATRQQSQMTEARPSTESAVGYQAPHQSNELWCFRDKSTTMINPWTCTKAESNEDNHTRGTAWLPETLWG